MNEEEKKAIERCNELIKEEHSCWIGISNQKAIDTVLNLIDKQNKVIDAKEQEIEYLNCIIESDKDNYINKDRIKEKIEKIENMYNELPKNPKEHLHSRTEYKIVIGELQSLLEKELENEQ